MKEEGGEKDKHRGVPPGRRDHGGDVWGGERHREVNRGQETRPANVSKGKNRKFE